MITIKDVFNHKNRYFLEFHNFGSPDKYRGLPIATSLEGCTHRLADVGNRVHTRNDSDEDVRGYACKQAIAWKALPWSFIT